IADRSAPSTEDYDYTYGDESDFAYKLPWTFQFYGKPYTEIDVDTNGNIWFASAGSTHSFDLAATGRGPVISAWNDDQSSYYYGGSFVQHKRDPERVVVEWFAENYREEAYYFMNHYEAVLFPNGGVRLDYKSFETSLGKDSGSGLSQGDHGGMLSL